MYLSPNSDLVPKHVLEIPMKDAFTHLPTRLKGIDDLDNCVVPSVTETGGQSDTVKLDDSGAEKTGEYYVEASWRRHISRLTELLRCTLAVFPAPYCSVTRAV